MIFEHLLSRNEKAYFPDITRQMYLKIPVSLFNMLLVFTVMFFIVREHIPTPWLWFIATCNLVYSVVILKHRKHLIKTRIWQNADIVPPFQFKSVRPLSPSQNKILTIFSIYALLPNLILIVCMGLMVDSGAYSLQAIVTWFAVVVVCTVPLVSAFVGIFIFTSCFTIFFVVLMYGYVNHFNYAQNELVVSLVILLFLVAVLHLQNQSFLQALQIKYQNQATSKELSQNNYVLLQAHRLQTQYLNAASMELRQPLQTLTLISHNLNWHNPEPEIEPSVHKIAQSVDSLIQSFDTMLNLSRLDAGGIGVQPTRFALQSLFERLIMDYQHSAHDKGLQLRMVPTQIWLNTDEGVLYSILSNFVSNAIRYTEHGHVVIGVRRRLNDMVDIQVIDTGVGINTVDLTRIFNEYERLAYAHQRAIGGVGLGLSIAKRMASLLQSEVMVNSIAQQGSVFGLRLPRSERPKLSSEANIGSTHEPQFSALQGKKIALLKDHSEYLPELKKLLELWGGLVQLIDSVENIIQLEPWVLDVDIIIGEYNLGALQPSGMDELSKFWLRTDSSEIIRPILILLTGNTSPKLSKIAHESGMIMIYKPIQPQALFTRLNQILTNYQNTSH